MDVQARVKKAQRINHGRLDDYIDELIETAHAEMIRVGVPDEVVNEGGSLIDQATVTFCLADLTEDKALIDKYEAAWRLQLDNIRKSDLSGEELNEAEEG